MFDQYYSSVKL